MSQHHADPLTPLVEALSATKGRDRSNTRLASVTAITGPQGGASVYVRFEGETVDSPRAYKRLASYTAVVGHRVLMLRVGSTWVVLGQVTT